MKKWIFVIILLLFSNLLSASNFSTSFADVILSNMKVGMVYSLKQEKGLPYTVTNLSEEPIDIEIIVQKPLPQELQEGYEAVPDISWVKVFPTVFRLEPGEKMNCDIIISIPDDEKYKNRHFQINLLTQTAPRAVGGGGLGISMAFRSRMRFSTGLTPMKVLDDHRRRIFDALKMELSPLSLFLPEISIGKSVRLDGRELSTLQMVNKGRENHRIEFHIAENPKNYGLIKGYEPIPEEIKVTFRRKNMRARRRSITDVIMDIKVPDKEEFYGRSFAFVVIGKVLGLDIPINLFARVYFKTEEKE